MPTPAKKPTPTASRPNPARGALMTSTATIAVQTPQLGPVLTREAPSAPPAGDPEQRRGTPPSMSGTRAAEALIVPSTYDAATHSVEMILSTGARVQRGWYAEELEISPEAIDLTRAIAGLVPYLNAHRQNDIDAVLGNFRDVRIENGQLIARCFFSQENPAGVRAEARVAAGELPGVSIGYVVRNWMLVESNDEIDVWRATRWELLEGSSVPVPADPNAGVRSVVTSPGTPAAASGEQEDDEMLLRNQPGGGAAAAPAPTIAAPTDVRAAPTATPAPAAPAVETVSAARLLEAANNAGLDAPVRERLLAAHADTPFNEDGLMAEIGRSFAARDQGQRQHNHIQVGNDLSREGRRTGMADAIVHRMSGRGQLSEQGRQYRGLSLVEMARECLTADGEAVRGLAPNQIAERALHSTSDLPYIVQSAMNRRLRESYEGREPTYRQWARRAPNAPNFKSIDVVQLSAMPSLLRVNEGGEIKAGTISDGKISYFVFTYARRLGITRQLIVNDDLRALDRFAAGFASSGLRLENSTVYGQLTGVNTYNGGALFHADNGNLAASGAALSATTLGEGRKRIRKQKGLQGESLNIAPRFLLAPTDLEQAAYQYTSSQFVPAQAAHINEFREGGRTALTPIIDSVLDASSATAFYLAADSADVDTIEWCYLDGAEGVQIAERMGFEIDGVEIKATLDFGSAVIDHRGFDKNPGA